MYYLICLLFYKIYNYTFIILLLILYFCLFVYKFGYPLRVTYSIWFLFYFPILLIVICFGYLPVRSPILIILCLWFLATPLWGHLFLLFHFHITYSNIWLPPFGVTYSFYFIFIFPILIFGYLPLGSPIWLFPSISICFYLLCS